MITRDEARMRALAFANRGKHVVEIMEAETREYDFGWVFSYQSAEFVRTRDPGKMLYGNAPVIVEKETGRTLQTGTAYPTDQFIEAYRGLGFDRFAAGDWREYLAAKAVEDEVGDEE